MKFIKQFEFMGQNMDCEQLNEIQTLMKIMVQKMPFTHV